ncbi:MAG: response regulator transcription factor [Ethanoligenens sp.]|uniref:response regulator transcription factor n=1 Tax=Ethanoligenens sp. TaxID=2099655 RepID=UPI0039EA5B5F
MIKVLIADDQELIRQSLQIVLGANADMTVTDTASNGREVLRCVRKEPPDVILMDIRMPEIDGVQCTKIIKENYPHIKVIVLTTFDEDTYIFSALKYGASGYLLKGVSMEELSDSIRKVSAGQAIINPGIATKVVHMFSKMAQSNLSTPTTKKNLELLSRTEKQVVREVGCGLSNKEIAQKLCLSEGTVRNYLSAILSKLDLRDRTQLAILATQSGILVQEPEDAP